MRYRMLWFGLFLSLVSWAAADLVDNFDTYPSGQVNTVTGGKWWSSTATWGMIEARTGSQQLMAINRVNLRGQLGDKAIESGRATLFTQFRASNTGTDHSFGLTDFDEAATWSDFVIQIGLISGTLRVSDAGTTRTLATGIAGGWSIQMYNLWVVIDYDAKTFQVYMNRETTFDPATVNEADRLKAGTIDTFGFRRIPTGPLDTFYIKGNNDQRIWLDNIYIDGDRKRANTPTPDNGATFVGDIEDGKASVLFQWKPGQNPDNLAEPYPLIRKYYLYLSKDKNLFAGDPNLYFHAEIEAGNPIAADVSYGPVLLNLDGKYQWAVDEGIEQAGGTVSGPTDPNTIRGSVWTFETARSIPVVLTQPVNALFDDEIVTPTTVFTLTTQDTPAPQQFEWYRSQDFANNTFADDVKVQNAGTDPAFILNQVTRADQGFYYCRIWNSPESVYSNVVLLGIKEKSVHWTLDGLVSDQYADQLGMFPADPNNPAQVQFQPDGVHGQGVKVDAASFALANSALDPTRYTNQITISAWIRVTGSLTDTDGFGIVSKRNDGSSDQWRWSLYARGRGGLNQRSVRLQTWNGGDAWTTANSIPANEWVHVCATVDAGRAGRIYVNGQVSGNTFTNWNWGPNAAAPVVLGRWTPTTSLFPGDIDDIQLWNYAFDKYQVIDLYHAGSGKSVCADPLPAATAVFDLNSDCKVDFEDFIEFAGYWLQCGRYPDCD
jgi:hypothetical protein